MRRGPGKPRGALATDDHNVIAELPLRRSRGLRRYTDRSSMRRIASNTLKRAAIATGPPGSCQPGARAGWHRPIMASPSHRVRAPVAPAGSPGRRDRGNCELTGLKFSAFERGEGSRGLKPLAVALAFSCRPLSKASPTGPFAARASVTPSRPDAWE